MNIVIYFLVFFSALLAFQLILGLGKAATARFRAVNKRVRESQKTENSKELLAKLRRDRGLNSDGYLENFNYRIARLALQSGLSIGQNGIYFIIVASIFLLSCLVILFQLPWFFFLPLSLIHISEPTRPY